MSLHRLIRIVPAGFAAALVVAACAEGCTVTTGGPVSETDFDSGVTTTPVPNNDSGTPPAAGGCNECLFQQCAGNWAVCQNDAECMAIYTCAVTTPSCDQNCINACFCAHPAGQSKYVALAACDSYYACESCQTQCPTLSTAAACTSPGVIQSAVCGSQPPPDAGTPFDDGGAPVDAAPPPPPPEDASAPVTDAATVQDCTTCTNTNCAHEKSACGSGTECEAYTLCLAACQDKACIDQCGTAHADGMAASQALETCTLNNCKAACGL